MSSSGNAIEIAGQPDVEELESGGGGFVDWTAQFLENAKERCLISCLSTDRVVGLMSS